MKNEECPDSYRGEEQKPMSKDIKVIRQASRIKKKHSKLNDTPFDNLQKQNTKLPFLKY